MVTSAEDATTLFVKRAQHLKYVKCIALVGSWARGEGGDRGDVDLLVIVDDTEKDSPSEEEAEDALDKLAESISPRLSIHTFTLTEFWGRARTGHPIVYSFIKDGKPLYDPFGLFEALKRLLQAGEIEYTPEAIERCRDEAHTALERMTLVRLLMLAEDAYKCFVRMGEAALMMVGEEVPPPRHLSDRLREVFGDVIKDEYLEWLREVVELRKKIEHREISDVKGEDLDEWRSRCQEYYEFMDAFLEALYDRKVVAVLDRSEEVLLKAMRTALAGVGVEPEAADLESVEKLFKEHFVDKGLVGGEWLTLIHRLRDRRKKVEEELERGHITRETREEVYQAREDVRSFIRATARALSRLKSQ